MKQTQQKPRTFSPVNLVNVPRPKINHSKPRVVYTRYNNDELQERRFNRAVISQAALYKQQRNFAIIAGLLGFVATVVLTAYLMINAAATIQRSNSLCREIAYERDIYESQLKDERRTNAALRQEIEAQNVEISNYRTTLDYYGLLDN